MNSIKRTKNKEITIIFIIIITITLFFSGYSMGKAYQDANIQASGKIAEPILVVENNPVIQVDGLSEKQYYNFKIKNSKDNGEVNQVDLEYNIEILTQTDEAISFKLYKNGDKTPILLENNKTQKMKMKKGEIQEDEYKLEITYDKTKNHSTNDIIQDVQIKVHSEQLKI